MIPDVLRSLLTAAGPSGHETAPTAVFREAAAAFAEVGSDTMGSVWARVAGNAGGRSLAVFGHVDEIGLIVSHIADDGFLHFDQVGGWDPQILVGQRVELMTRSGTIPGVVGKKPIHLLSADERKKVPELRDLHIDVGARDGDDAAAMVRVGDVAVIAAEPVELPNDRLVSRAMDNRLGAFVALEAARLVAEAGGGPGDVIAVANTQEETTLGGAATSAYALRPDAAIVVDVTHATDAPGVEEKAIGRHRFGSGAVIGRGSMLAPRLTDLLVETAEEEGIDHSMQAFGRRTGTDADVVNLSRAGVPTAIVSIPLRYMHSPVEMVQLSDVHAAARLIAAAARRLTSDVSFTR